MDQTPDRSRASARHRRAYWMPARQCQFLAALMESGSVARAARTVGMSRSSAHRLRHRLAGTAFDRQWEEALVMHAGLTADPLVWTAARAAIDTGTR